MDDLKKIRAHEHISAAEFRSIKPRKRGRFPVSAPEDRTIDGIAFASKREMNRYLVLKLREKQGEISRLELQPKFPVFINGVLVCTYTGDFQFFENGEIVIEDVKSSGTAKDEAYRVRKRCAESYYGISIIQVWGVR